MQSQPTKLISQITLSDTFAFTGTVSGTPSDMVLLSTVDASSGTSAVVFNSSVVTTAYKNYYITGHGIYAQTNSQTFRFYQSSDNGSSFTGDNKKSQFYQNLYGGGSSGQDQATVSGSGYFVMGSAISSSTVGGSCNIWVNGSNASNWKDINYLFTHRNAGGESYTYNGACEQQNGSAYNYFKFQMSSGNLYGYYYLFGLKG